MPRNTIQTILQTRDGYLWVGTLGGLARFDGESFQVFSPINTPELRSLRIRDLYQDNDGNLWIAADPGGLTRYRDGKFTNFGVRDGLPDDSVLSIAGDRDGIWIGTMRGLARFHAGRLVSYASKGGIPPVPISAICRGSKGRLWLGTYTQGLISLAGGQLSTYGTKDGLPSNEIWSLHEDGEGYLWIGTREGLARIKNGKVSRVFAEDGRPLGRIRDFSEDEQRNLLVAARAGLFRWDGHTLTRFRSQGTVSRGRVRSVFVDRENNIWTGPYAGGLNCWRKSSVVGYAAKQGLGNQVGRAIYQDREGKIWVAIGRNIFTFHDGRFQVFRNPNASLIDGPTAFDEDGSGTLWIGDRRGGLLSLKNGQLRTFTTPQYPLRPVETLYTDDAGAVWIGTQRNGAYRYKDGVFTNYRIEEGLESNTVNCITEDRDGDLWMGTSAGISRFKDGHFTNYRTRGLASVEYIHVAADGTLWIGSYGYGLFRFKDHKFARITSKDGLFDNVVSSILEDNHGNLWMGGNKGIFRVSESELNAFADGRLNYINSVSYGMRDGMITSETNGAGQPSAWKARDGKLWFAMTKGIVVIDPDVYDRLPPPVVIEQVALDGKNLPPSQSVRIQPGQMNLEIHYAAPSFKRPDRIQFKYRLTGLDQNWVDAGTRRTAYFPDLPIGKYTFKVIADNGEGVWNNVGASLDVIVIPPFYRTWWFLSLIAATLAGTALIAYQARVNRLKRAKAGQEAFSRQLLASQEAERQRIAASLHDSLGQSLLIIKNRADLALTSTVDEEATKEQLDEISAAAAHAVEEVREIAYNLRPYQLDRFGLTKTLHGICHQASRSCGIQFSTSLDQIDGLLSKEAETNVYRIVQESLSNIIRYSQATTAEVLVRRAGRGLLLRISDNGKGFVPAAAGSPTSNAGGFGLVGMAERVRMLGGSYKLDSVPGQGTTITILLAISGGYDARRSTTADC